MFTSRFHLRSLVGLTALLLGVACLARTARAQEPAPSDLEAFWLAAFHAPFDPGRSAVLVDEELAPGVWRVSVVEIEDCDTQTTLATEVLLAEIARFPVALPTTSGHELACAAAILSAGNGLETALVVLSADTPALHDADADATPLHLVVIEEAWSDPGLAIVRAEEQATALAGLAGQAVLPPDSLAATAVTCDECDQLYTGCVNLANKAYDDGILACTKKYDADVKACLLKVNPRKVAACLLLELAAFKKCEKAVEEGKLEHMRACMGQLNFCLRMCTPP